jgi:hypothetical protein
VTGLDPVFGCRDRPPLQVLCTLPVDFAANQSTLPAMGKYPRLNSINGVFVLSPSNTDAETALDDIYSDDLRLG